MEHMEHNYDPEHDEPPYITEDGYPVPDKVAAKFAHWEDWYRQDPANIDVWECPLCGNEHYSGHTAEATPLHGQTEYGAVNEWGEIVDVEHLETPGRLMEYMVSLDDEEDRICGWCYESFEEHGTTLGIYNPDGTSYFVVYEYPVVRLVGNWMDKHDDLDSGMPEWELVESIIEGTYTVTYDAWRSSTVPASKGSNGEVKFTNLADGWLGWGGKHEFSERLREVTSGEVVPPTTFVISTGKTSNVMSITASLLVPEPDVEVAKQFMDGADAEALHGRITYHA